MRLSENWKDYELLDTSDGERLERWGDIILIRPDPQIIWSTPKKDPLWHSAHARYRRSNKGGGSWYNSFWTSPWRLYINNRRNYVCLV